MVMLSPVSMKSRATMTKAMVVFVMVGVEGASVGRVGPPLRSEVEHSLIGVKWV